MGTKQYLSLSSEETAQLIARKSREIVDTSMIALGHKLGELAGQSGRSLAQFKIENEDILLLVIGLLSGESGTEASLNQVVQILREERYSISDLFLLVSCLEESLEKVLMRTDTLSDAQLRSAVRLSRKNLFSFFQRVLEATSEVYEYATKWGGRGFCQTDAEGTIIYANDEMKSLLGLDNAQGYRLDSFFEGQEQKFVIEALKGQLGNKPCLRKLLLTSRDGKSIPVGAEISPILFKNSRMGAYAGITNISQPIQEEQRVFDKSPLGIAELNIEGKEARFTYANRKMLEICGTDFLVDKPIRAIFPDDNSFERVKDHIEDRRRGLSDEYEVEIIRMNDKKRIPVRIAAMPKKDLSGNVTGSMAIVCSLELEKTVQAIHEQIETKKNVEEMLAGVAMLIKRLVPFEIFAVSAYSSDMRHSRALFSYPPRDSGQWERRWWELSEDMRRWVSRKEVDTIGNFKNFLSQRGWLHDLEKEKDIQDILRAGIHSFLRFPVFRGDNLVASVSLLHRDKNAYNNEHVKMLNRLPLDKAVSMARYYEEQEDLKFRLELIQQISLASDNVMHVAEALVNQLANHYKWPSVSVFRVEEETRLLKLLSQNTSYEKFSLPDNYEQPLDEGVLGYVYRNRIAVNLGDVRTDPEFKTIHKKAIHGTVSELCLPIIMEGKVRWLLNIEDVQKNAFSEDEKNNLQDIMKEVSTFLERTCLNHFLQATLDFASDAVIITDNEGQITKTNRAAIDFLGESSSEIRGTVLWDYLKADDMREDILTAEKVLNEEFVLLRKDGTEKNVLLSGSQLPEEFGRKVFIAKDLYLHKRVKYLEHLEEMFYEIALQMKTPLSLAYGYLNRLKSNMTRDVLKEAVEKAMKQLRKVELSYDRLALYDTKRELIPEKLLLDVATLLDRIRDDLPTMEIKNNIRIECDRPLRYLRGDPYQLTFCLETILGYLMRYMPEEEKIHLRIWHDADWLKIQIAGFLPVHLDEDMVAVAGQTSMAHVLTEMALGEDIIKTIVAHHDGVFHKPKREDQRIAFRIDLPLSERKIEE